MTRKKHRKGTSRGTAFGLLIVCAGIAFFSLRGQFGGGNGGAASVAEPMVDDADAVGVEADADALTPGVDLLLRHGSWQVKQSVRMAFVGTAEAALAAAPTAETALSAMRQWVGADPPTMHLGVLMVGDTVRRAVVDGRVIGVGDTVGRALIVAIERDAVTATWGGKRLTYDLEGDHPREFRAELQRRGIDQNAVSTMGAADKIQESRQ
jgi:hypothetical protein